MIAFVLITLRMIRRDARSTVIASGVTWPPTTASPRPQAALISIMVSSPVTGSAVNTIPDASASMSSCTTTARLIFSGLIWCCAR